MVFFPPSLIYKVANNDDWNKMCFEFIPLNVSIITSRAEVNMFKSTDDTAVYPSHQEQDESLKVCDKSSTASSESLSTQDWYWGSISRWRSYLVLCLLFFSWGSGEWGVGIVNDRARVLFCESYFGWHETLFWMCWMKYYWEFESKVDRVGSYYAHT